MPAAIRSIETAVPATIVGQAALRDLLHEQEVYGPLGRRVISAAFDGSEIETRHSVLEELGSDAPPRVPALYEASSRRLADPGTAARNDAYALYSKPLLVEAARKALAGAPGLDAADVTHVVTVSCTGFYAPGPDYVLVRELGLRPSTQRFHLGFMGCYAAFPALRMAAQFCEADPSAVVLVVSVELCSLHLHVVDDPDAIVAASVFGDGAAAAVVTAQGGSGPQLDLDAFESTIVPEGAGEMAWTIGDHGFDMVLSSYVPKIVERNIGAAFEPLLAGAGLAVGDVDAWAVHPGGRSILDRVQSALGLDDELLAPSRRVLREFGNMSSASVLFILSDLLHEQGDGHRAQELALATTTASAGASALGEPAPRPTALAPSAPRRVAAVAFGPGLTVETALLTLRAGS